MATKIVTKNSSTASAVPTASDLVQGELAVNVADKRLYTENASGIIVEVGTNPSAEIIANGGIALPDSQKATFGAGDDLQIYHDGNHSYISEQGTGNLRIYANDLVLANNDGSQTFLYGQNGGPVSLSYANNAKLATTSTGIDITGTATMDGLTVDGSAAVNVPSSQQITFSRTGSSVGSGKIGADISQAMGIWDVDDNKVATFYQNQDVAFYEDTGTTAKLFWDASAESLGIGTSSIAAGTKLQVAGETRIYPDSGTGVLRFGSGGAEKGKLSVDTSSNMMFETGGSERMRIDSSGNLLVGKTSTAFGTEGFVYEAGAAVEVTTDSNRVMRLNRTTSDGNIIELNKDGTTVGSIGTSTGGLYIADSGVGFRFDSGGTDDIIPCNATGGAADASINLGSSGARFKDLYLSGGVSTNTATGLSITADSSNRGILNLSTSTAYQLIGGSYYGYTGYKTGGYHRWFGSDGGEDMRIDSSGNLLVSVTSITDATSRSFGNAFSGSGTYANWTSWGNGTGHTHASFRNATNVVGTISTTASATTYNTSSDERLKENITDANDAGDKIDAIKVRQYDWKADGSHQDYGMVAQELQAVAPEAVSGDADSEEMMGVDYSKLVPMLIKEIQSLRNRVAQLEE